MKGFQLQERVKGVEIAVCGFFNGEKFIEHINLNFEHKKLFPGNIGPSTGEMGTSMTWTKHNEIFEKTLGRLEDMLAEEGYVGSIDINCIVDESGIYPLEFTPRFGYPTITIQEKGMETPIGEFLSGLAHGKDIDLKVKKGFQIGVRVCMPPFPFDDEKIFKESTQNAAITFEDGNREGVHIEDVKKIDEQWRVAGTSGVVLVVAGSGTSMKEAQKEAYERIENVILPNMYYRDDIGDRWFDDGDKLHAWGYLS